MDEQGCRDLRVEHLHAPIAVGADAPRFSWIADHAQASYRLIVRDRRGDLQWDSGLVASAETSLIEYAGRRLRSDADYGWTVESRDAAGALLTGSSRFGTALLAAGDWVAPWIEPEQQPTAIERWTLRDWITGSVDDTAPAERLRPAQLLRQEFTLAVQPVRARLFVTAHGVYQATMNGRAVGDEVLAPGFDSYLHRICVQCHDVTDLVTAGQNVLGVALADGWWAGRIGITGSSAQFGDRTAATWQLHVELPGGQTRRIRSAGDVRSAPGPWRYADLFVGECYDARAVPTGWDEPGFDAAAWAPVTTTAEPTAALTPFTGEPIRRIGELPAVSVRRAGDVFVVDFGQVIAGRVRLSLSGLAAGQAITIEHTETLGADGEWFDNIVGINKDQADVFVSAGGAHETYEPTFTYHGFRYARIAGVAVLTADDIVAVVIGSDLEYTGRFATSDARLNRLHENAVWSMKGNFVSVPTDCPQREKVGWTGDAQAFAPAAASNALVAPFFSRWLANLRADQLPGGAVPITSPRSPFDAAAAAQATGIGGIVHAAGWSDAIAFVPWTIYEHCGDRRVLADNLDAVLAWVAFQRRQSETGDWGDQFGDWLAPSTLEGLPPHEAILVAPTLTGALLAPMFQAQTLTIAARMCRVLGRAPQADELAARAAAVRSDFAAAHIDAHGDLPVRLQGVYTLALAFDMVPPALRERTADRLATLVRERGDRLDTGFLSVPYLLDVLWESGHRDLARRVLWQHRMPSWLYEVDAGATTIWESWDAVGTDGTPRAVSFNHYAFGCVDDWLYRRVAGIRPLAPGYRRAVIEPDLEAGVTSVHASVPTPYGPITLDWQHTGDGARITCAVPHGVEAELVLGGERTALHPGESTHVRAHTPVLT
ncbi:family 78 glycoside hydrolase catalytic domain [Microbacterium fluvii]|uniref:alpha-L-rhamnosidase n=1 Tax=Microbacterium fluvii TaxID=415215 RepID=A0ABW2HEY5_9MICO|nr:alpha-L-rhamnosidase [Microbacterium fluvii]MCU4672708.1 glycoside hydrolase family 78 protein [Microbacterium fluvii]